jgi:hypothetical protein
MMFLFPILEKLKTNYKDVLNKYEIKWEEEQHTEDEILNADVVMKSPGIPDKAPIVKKLLEKGIPVISEIEFAYPFTNAITIGITGSNGKTTTTMLDLSFAKRRRIECGFSRKYWKEFCLASCRRKLRLLCVGIEQFSVGRNYQLQTTHCNNYKYKSRSFR